MKQLDPDNKYAHWSDMRLKSTSAYLRNTLKSGHPDIYDAEEDRLRFLDIETERARRSERKPDEEGGLHE